MFNVLASLAVATLVAAVADDSTLVAQLITTNTQVNRVADVTPNSAFVFDFNAGARGNAQGGFAIGGNSALQQANDLPSTSDLNETSLVAPFDHGHELERRTPGQGPNDNLEATPARSRRKWLMMNTMGTSRQANVLNIAGDHITHNHTVAHAQLESIDERLKIVHDREMDKDIHGWLAAPDVSQKLNAARRKYEPRPYSWFIDGNRFAEWLQKPESVMCIYGPPGCGKTILSSAVTDHVINLCPPGSPSSYAYFFFDGRNSDDGLLHYENLMRSLLSQAAYRCGGIPTALSDVYRAHGNGREHPSLSCLRETLERVLQEYDHFYIVIDSLDECGDRLELLAWISSMASWKSNRLHLLLTSRPEADIMDNLSTVAGLSYVRWNEETLSIIETPLIDDNGGILEENMPNVVERGERRDSSQIRTDNRILPAQGLREGFKGQKDGQFVVSGQKDGQSGS
ncbi:hypothetical protein FIBSPDRAFT_949634 [Athelia psychrophila]|uniref:NACHT domain-containing protein n=1 Tax=Athelia psychrophila TaxID=1759441 RepID=A0A166PJP3_9AGAM|nr:hypothetical protein FIBSPDRAFT_949634 [Fibularhizoctonia sp. CBS 109695]